ncbi:hypothetical protein [Flagellimonas algicola]|uniref:hypothetical protein n=1 Tax=Flagellimonas algicola TaxID=2583815 RepID=UPI001F16B2F1|nr:hypothetical protein [Allomuricauda algicola]
MSSSKPGRSTAIISYITIVGCLIAITMNMEPKHAFTRMHARQAFGIHLIYHAFATYLNMTNMDNIMVWSVLWVVYLGAILYGFIGAINNNERLLPGLGANFQKWFTFIP